MTETELVKIAKEKGWKWISEHQKLSEAFIEKYKDRVEWNCIKFDPIDKIILLGKIKEGS
jgi:hypothetical protein